MSDETVDTTPSSLTTLVNGLAQEMRNALPAGDVAALRRLDPEAPSVAAFWKILVSRIEPASPMPSSGEARDEVERRWAIVLNALARLGDLHAPRQRLGQALASARFSELRLARLLRAQGASLRDEVRRATSFLAAKSQPVDAVEIARLVLSDGRSDSETVRRGIARDFFTTLSMQKGA